MTTHYGKDALHELEQNVEGWDERYPLMADGSEIKVSHATCPAGEDRRERFGVKCVDGAFLWHCFNCGDSGFWRPRDTYRRLDAAVFEAEPAMATEDWYEKAERNYTRAERNVEEFTLESKLWLEQYGMTDDTEGYGIRECKEGLMLPVWADGEFYTDIVGYQIRQRNAKPKYLTYTKQPFSYLKHGGIKASTLIITEDLLSSYKLHRVGYSTISLLGTSLKAPLSKLPAHSGRVMLWLDSDAAGMKGTMEVIRQLGTKYEDMSVFVNDKEPKECDFAFLRSVDGT
jgi:hypothetical protein